MFRMNGNRRRLSKAKPSNQVNQKPATESNTEYKEDFNEIILNDLVPNDKKEEFGLENTTNYKKSSGLKINLGLGGKKSSKKPSSKKKHQSNDEQEILDKKTNHNKSKTDNGTEYTKENTIKHNKINKKHKKHSTSHTQHHKEKEVTEIINEPKDNSEVIESSPLNKKGSKKAPHNKRKRRPSQNETQIEEVRYEESKLEEVEIEDTIDENNVFRCEEKINNEFNEENLKRKFENLVWSEDKFPKKQ